MIWGLLVLLGFLAHTANGQLCAANDAMAEDIKKSVCKQAMIQQNMAPIPTGGSTSPVTMTGGELSNPTCQCIHKEEGIVDVTVAGTRNCNYSGAASKTDQVMCSAKYLYTVKGGKPCLEIIPGSLILKVTQGALIKYESGLLAFIGAVLSAVLKAIEGLLEAVNCFLNMVLCKQMTGGVNEVMKKYETKGCVVLGGDVLTLTVEKITHTSSHAQMVLVGTSSSGRKCTFAPPPTPPPQIPRNMSPLICSPSAVLEVFTAYTKALVTTVCNYKNPVKVDVSEISNSGMDLTGGELIITFRSNGEPTCGIDEAGAVITLKFYGVVCNKHGAEILRFKLDIILGINAETQGSTITMNLKAGAVVIAEITDTSGCKCQSITKSFEALLILEVQGMVAKHVCGSQVSIALGLAINLGLGTATQKAKCSNHKDCMVCPGLTSP